MKFLASIKISPHKFKTPEGFLICRDCVISSIGKQQYMKSEIYQDSNDDTIIDVNRTEKEVFDEKSLASMEGKPICLDHPDVNVTPENYHELSVGHVQNIHRGEDNGQPVVMGDLFITNPEAIEAVESGEYKDLSAGYDCDITEGPEPEQVNIRINHIALCQEGRCKYARIVDKNAVKDSIGKGSLIQEFGKQGKQYKVSKIEKNVIYAEELGTGKIVLFHKDKEGEEWASITKSEVKDSPIDRSRFKSVEETNELTKKHGSYQFAQKMINKEFDEKVKKFPYWVIKTSDWYDPEGLNIPDDSYTIIYGGTEQQCKDKLIGLHEEALNDKEYQDVEKYVHGKSLQIYYPHAIVRAYYSIMKNPGIIKDSKVKDAHIALDYINPTKSPDKEFLNGIAKKYNCSVRNINNTPNYDEVVFEGTKDNLIKLATGEEFDLDEKTAREYVIDYVIKAKDAGQLKQEIVNAIKDVLGEKIKIDYGTRGIGNIVIRFDEEKRSPYMQNASLQGVLIALEKAGIKVDKSRSTVNRYMIEIWTNAESSKELTDDSAKDEDIKKVLESKGFKYQKDVDLGINSDKDGELWIYEGTGHFPEVVERLVNEYPSLISFKNSSDKFILIRKKYLIKDDKDYSNKFYHKAIEAMKEHKENLKEEETPDENKVQYAKHKERLDKTLSENIKKYRRKLREE